MAIFIDGRAAENVEEPGMNFEKDDQNTRPGWQTWRAGQGRRLFFWRFFTQIFSRCFFGSR
jgi:hypothetical protein